jgi:hypothetical protein
MPTDPNNSTGQIRASIRDIALGMRQQIIATTGLDDSAVYILRRREPPRLVAEFAVGLWVRGERNYGQALVGGGRVNAMMLRTITVLVWSRNLLDEADRDSRKLMDYNLGQIQLEDQVVDALEVYTQLNAAKQARTAFPMSIGGISDPKTDPKNANFTVSEVDVTVPYTRALNQNIPNQGTVYPSV